MNRYYNRRDVRQAMLDFVYSGSSSPLRECAFYNNNIGGIQRHMNFDDNRDSLFVIASDSSFDRSLRAGATAFYSSYWRYDDPYKAKRSRGRDLVWTLRAVDGGLSVVKEVASSFVGVLQEEGFSPLVKYSGKLGFDVLISLEEAEERIVFDLNAISKAQEKLTGRITNKISDRTDFALSRENSDFVFEGGLGTCLLSELSWGRGLLLAPMSLHPSSGLVSAPVPPEEIGSFSALDASPEAAFPYQWNLTSRIQQLASPTDLISVLDSSAVGV